LSALRAACRSPHTLANYRHAVDKLTAWRGDVDVTTVSRFEAMRFVQHLTDIYTPGGVSNRVRALRACFSWLLAEELVESNPFARIKITVPAEAQTTATDEQI
jgi:site-specific recombinase XerC